MAATRAVVIGNRDDADVGVLGEWAERRGIELAPVERAGGARPALGTSALVVSLGSAWRVHDPQLAPVVAAEQALLRDAVAREVPVLAICFGMQQLTLAFDGKVFATPEPEIGYRWVDASDDAVPAGPWMQYHHDACALPPGAVALAANDHALQAYRLGSALAVQFHPEVDLGIVERWSIEGAKELSAFGLSAPQLIAEAEVHAEASRRAALSLFDAFWSSA